MNPVDPELLSLTNELAKLGGSRKVKLSRISVFIRGIRNASSPVSNVNFISYIEENNQIIIRHPSSANDMRCYDISKYFPPSISNHRVSADLVNKITTSIFDGFNINLITYGATNTGKSQLLFGSSSDNMQYDSCEGLFGTLSANILRKIDQSKDNISLSLSIWEIGQNQIVDLTQTKNQNKIQSPFEITSVTVANWEEICSIWDIARHNSSNWKTLNTGYEVIPNESNLFIQIKIYNQSQQRVTTLNLIDLVGCYHMSRSVRPHISREKVEQNKEKNVNLFSLNKLLHHLCNLHLQTQDNHNILTKKPSTNKDLVQNVIAESLLNNFIGPMITQNAETIFVGTVSCNASDYQSSLRTIQVLSRTLSISVPCMHTPFNIHNHNNNQSSIISFAQFLSKWQSILYKHMMIENSIQQQMQFVNNNHTQNNNNNHNIPQHIDQNLKVNDKSISPIQPNNITQAINDFEISMDDESLNDQLQELRKNIPQNILDSKPQTIPNQEEIKNGTNKQIKQEISSLLDDILQPKQNDNNNHNIHDHDPSKNQDSFLKSNDFEQMIKSTKASQGFTSFMDEFKTHSKDTDAEPMTNDKQQDNTVAHLEFTNLRLENCKLKEEIRKLKAMSTYTSIFEDYDREISTLKKLLESMSNDNRLLSSKNMQLKHQLTNYKLTGNKTDELKTVRILQRSLRDTTKKLKKCETALMKLSGDIRHKEIRNRVLSKSKEEWLEMSQLLSNRESELGQSYLIQAQTQAIVDKLGLQNTELQHENNTLQMQCKSLENEVSTLRLMCKKINDDIKQRNQLHRVSKKWGTRRK